MSTMSILRARAFAEKAMSESSQFAPDEAAVKRVVDKAYKDLTDLVSRIPHRRHYHDTVLGGRSYTDEKINMWINSAKEYLAKTYPNSGIRLERYQFSNVGDPYYMGPPDMIVQKGIRFIA